MNSKYIFQSTGIIIMFFLCLHSCGPINKTCKKDKTIFDYTDYSNKIFTGQFYDYFERGLYFIECKCFKEAREDFQKAIALRSLDKRWAQTYGMHYIDYFPHRELGIVHYLIGNYNEAKSELEISISQEPSEKAYEYLDCVRSKILHQKLEKQYPHISKKQLNPQIFIENDHINSNAKVIIKGLVKISPLFQNINDPYLYHKNFIKHITINNKKYFIDISKPEIEFFEELNLDEGKYEIKITAGDILGNTEKQIIYVNIDKTGPVISIDKYLPGVLIKGFVQDDSGSIKMTIDDKDVEISGDKTANFSISLFGKKNFKIIAKDSLGNRTFAFLKKNNSAQFLNMYADNNFVFEMTDAFNQKTINSEPKINLYGHDGKKSVTVYKDEIEITGEISGNAKIKSLIINNNKLIFRNEGKYWGHLISLNEGENIIQISAITDQNIQYRKKYIVNRKVCDVFSNDKRYAIEISKFKNSNNENNDKINLFHSYLVKSFVNKKRFNIIDRNTKNSGKGNSQALLCGTYNTTMYGIEIIAWFTEKKTGNIIFLKDVYVMNKTSNSIRLSAERLSEKIHQEVPIITGSVLAVNNDNTFCGLPNGEMTFLTPDLYVYRIIDLAYNHKTGAFWGNQYKTVGSAKLTEIKLKEIKAKHEAQVGVKLSDLFINQ